MASPVEEATGRGAAASLETLRRTEAQEEAISAQIAASQPLVGPVENIAVLRAEYAANPRFLGKIDSLCSVATAIRRARGDGNCFYRSYCFAIMEWAQRWLHPSADISAAAKASASAKYDAFLAGVRGSAATLIAHGYDEMVFEDYLEEAVELFEAARTCSRAELEARAADEPLWNGLVFFVKLLAAAQIKGHPDDFAPFIEATMGLSIEAFCSSQVEAMWVECDHLQIVALTGALGLGVKVWYLDGAGGSVINGHVFPEAVGDDALVHLLFRPGHYDILHVE